MHQLVDVKSEAGNCPDRKVCLLVLGMHRSGTSAFTRMLNLLGATLPKHLMPAAEDNNEAGFWEPKRLVDLHDAMLVEAGSRWDDWRAFDPSALGAERLAYYKSELLSLIAEEFGQADLFTIKDPRICRFVPFYEATLGQAGIECRFILPYRNPLAVIASLQKRDGMTEGFAGLVWLRHVLDAEVATRGKPRMLVSYEASLDEWRDTAVRLGEVLGIEWPRGIEEATADIDAYIDPSLQHHAPSLAELEGDERVAGWVKQAYAALVRMSEGDETATQTLDAIRAEFEAVAPVFGQAVFPELALREQRFEKMRRHAEALTHVRAENTKTIEKLSRKLAGSTAKQAPQQERIDELTRQMAERETAGSRERAVAASTQAKQKKRIGELLKANAEAVAETETLRAHQVELSRRLGDQERREAALNAELDALRSSRDWRFRAFLDRLRQMPRRFLFWFGRAISLTPAYDLQAVASDGGATEWVVTGDDPQVELIWPSSVELVAGHYRLWFQVPKGIEMLGSCQLYVDSGHGYNETEVVRLSDRAASPREFAADFILPAGARRLRFDPSDRPGEFATGRARLRRISRFEYYAGLASRGLRRNRGLSQQLRRAVRVLRDKGIKGLAARLRQIDYPVGWADAVSYADWIDRVEASADSRAVLLRQELASLVDPPKISVVMPVYDTPENLLSEAIESVRNQLYQNWELCIADDCSTKPHVRRVLEHYAKTDKRIRVVFRESNGHISHATNSAFELASGEWIALLDHDDVLREHALAEVALEIGRHPDAQLIYSDEDKLDAKGTRYDPYFKPDFSRELFRSQNYFNHLTVHRADNIRAVGGWRPDFEGSQDYDLNLRIVERIDPATIRHIPKVLYHWRAAEGSTAAAGSEKSYAWDAGFRALQEHVERTGLAATVEAAPDTPFYRIRMAVPEPAPLVSLIIPTRDKVKLLKGCVESIREKTTYQNYEILIVDNGSSEPDTLAYFEALKRTNNVRVIRYEKPFNYSAINNFAVKKARGEIVGLVNNDIEVIAPDWLSEMVSWAVQPDVGCVGAKLYYANDTIQHAGVILGIGGVAGHSHKHFPRHHPGYFVRLKVLQNLSAVTAACLLVRKSIYAEVGGLDEENLQVAFNDVDFCLKVRAAGYLNVWTPYAELYHLESVSRGADDNPEKIARFGREIEHMQRKWHLEDAYYSPNLTLVREDFSLGG